MMVHGWQSCLTLAFASMNLKAVEGIRLDSQDVQLDSTRFLGAISQVHGQQSARGQGVWHSICNSEAMGRLPYSTCLFASSLYGRSGVRIRHWSGGRLGNDIVQLMHAIVYAEALGRPEVILPHKGGHLAELFDMPAKLSIRENDDLQHRARCSFGVSSDFFDGSACKGIRRNDYRRALLQYLKPRLNSAAKKACASEGQGFAGLTIHLRSGDLLHSDHKQGRFLPCAYHDVAINTGSFKELRVVTEPDMAHPCLEPLQKRHADKLVLVQSGSIHQDACALMTAQHLEYGDTTFAQVLELMNENVKDVAMPRMLGGGARDWYSVGSAEDPMGLLSQCPSGTTANDAFSKRRYTLYSAADVRKIRQGQDRTNFLVMTPASSLHVEQVCDAV
jgi:hypothetical protein